MAGAAELPLRDPDGLGGSPAIRLPAILALFGLLDILPRAAITAWRRRGGFGAAIAARARERWTMPGVGIVLVGLVSFYLTYLSYRNLKSFLPFLREDRADAALLDLDRGIAFGIDPSTLLHQALGTGIAAHVLSLAYMFFLLFVPMSVAAALVWTRDMPRGYWYVTALGINWVLGIVSYYVLPSLGPVYVEPGLFADLPQTGVSSLQGMLLEERQAALAGPDRTAAMQSIAGFASLHVSIVFTAAAIAWVTEMNLRLRRGLWVLLALIGVATIYFGWHYVVDDVAGLAIGAAAVWLGGVATGHDVWGMIRQRWAGRRPRPATSPLNLPNALTAGRILFVPVLVMTIVHEPSGSIAAAVLFGGLALSDIADGYLARSRGRVTTLGKLLDPVADKLLIGGALLSLAAVGRLAFWVPAIVLGRDLVVTLLRMVALHRGVVIEASALGKAKMALQTMMILMLILAPDPHAAWVDVVVAATVIATLGSGLSYVARLPGPSGAPSGSAAAPASRSGR